MKEIAQGEELSIFGHISPQLIRTERLVRLLMNVNPETLAKELVERVAKGKTPFVTFLEEKDGIDRLCDAIFPNDSTTDEDSNWSILQKTLLVGYEIAEEKIRNTKVEGVPLNER